MSTDKRSLQTMIGSANARSLPGKFQLQSHDIVGLLKESFILAQLVATEKRDLLAIRADYELRLRQIEMNAQMSITMIQEEYKERSAQIAMLDKNVQLLIEVGQFEIASQIMNRMADILSESPLKRALSFRLLT
jgi:hypothetical protein